MYPQGKRQIKVVTIPARIPTVNEIAHWNDRELRIAAERMAQELLRRKTLRTAEVHEPR